MLHPDEEYRDEENGDEARRETDTPSHVDGGERRMLLSQPADMDNEVSPFRLPPFLPSLLLMLAAACYLCFRMPPQSYRRQPAVRQSTPAATTQQTSMVSTIQPLAPPLVVPLLELKMTSAHPVYGSMDEETRELYGWEVVLEAGTDTLLTLHNGIPGSRYEWRLQSADGKVFFAEATSNTTVLVRCPTAGVALNLSVTEHPAQQGGGPSRSYTAGSAVCKRIRREIRTLVANARDRYLDALNLFYRTTMAEGQRLYGPDFVNAAWITACHNSRLYCLYTPNPFLSAHAAFVYWGEESIRLIDPTVALPYWDHMVDTVQLGPRWADSPLFRDDWFGTIKTDRDTNYTITRGRFAQMPVAVDRGAAYDPFKPGVDVFGHVNLGFTLNGAPIVTRCDEVCGLRSPVPFSPPEHLFNCYERNDQWEGANGCMYHLVHSQMHSHLSGTWDCAHNLSRVYEDYAPVYDKGLLAYLGIAGKLIWFSKPSRKDRGLSAYRHCHLPTRANCTCRLDVDSLPLLQLEHIMAPDLDTAMAAYPGDLYIRRRPSDKRYTFMSHGKDLSPIDNERLMRLIAKIWCQGAKDGHYAGMVSINDPIFYTSHAFYDRLFHFVMTSPELRQTLNMTWGVDHGKHCTGEWQSDQSPFPNFFTRPHRDRTLSMLELGELLHPHAVSLPHVYDDVVHWGGQAWRPREHAAWKATARHVASKSVPEKGDSGERPEKGIIVQEQVRPGNRTQVLYQTQSEGGNKAVGVEAAKAAMKGRGQGRARALMNQARQRLRPPGLLRVGEGAAKHEAEDGEEEDEEDEEEEGEDSDGSEEDDDDGEGDEH